MFTINHDPVRHLRSLRQALSQQKKPIAFLIGAGCPLAVKMPSGQWPLIPNVEMLTTYVNTELLKDGSDVKEIYSTLLKELELTGKNTNNIENVLSFVRTLIDVSIGGTVRNLDEGQLKEIELNVCKKILEKLDKELPNRHTPYHNLASWIYSIERECPIEVFTTNYDLLMEQAFEDLHVPYFDGYVGSREAFFDLRAVEEKNLISKHCTRFWKIHGSINWFQNKAKEVYRGARRNDDSVLIYPSHLKYEQSRKMPFLALFDRLNAFLRQKESPLLITIGYSFCDEHINYTLINGLRSNPSAAVIGLLYGSSSDIEGLQKVAFDGYEKAKKITTEDKVNNLSIWTFDGAIIGTIGGRWKSLSKPVEELGPHENPLNCIKEKIIYKKDEHGNLTDKVEDMHHIVDLSDFNVCASVLQSMVGQ